MKFMVTIGARMFTWPIKMNAMVIRLVKQIAATGVLFGPFYVKIKKYSCLLNISNKLI